MICGICGQESIIWRRCGQCRKYVCESCVGEFHKIIDGFLDDRYIILALCKDCAKNPTKEIKDKLTIIKKIETLDGIKARLLLNLYNILYD